MYWPQAGQNTDCLTKGGEAPPPAGISNPYNLQMPGLFDYPLTLPQYRTQYLCGLYLDHG